MGSSVYTWTGTGGGAVAVSGSVPAGMSYRLVQATCHLSAAPVTAGNITVTLNAGQGGDFDTLLQAASLVGVTDYVWLPDQDLIFNGGDAIDVAYANPDARTYGCQLTMKAV